MILHTGRPARLVLLRLALLVTSLASTGCLSAGERDDINDWLLCDECTDGQLNQVVDGIGWRAVRRLAGALVGPPAARVENIRWQLRGSYAQSGGGGMSEAQYVERYLGNYVALYQKRAAVALARIGQKGGVGSRRAIRELQLAVDRYEAGLTTYRSDVIRVIRRAVFTASGTPRWSAVAAGFGHSCALTTAGDTYCWGGNTTGALGDGTTTQRNAATALARPIPFATVQAGALHTCALLEEGTGYCWGFGTFGQLGNGLTEQQLTPVPVVGPARLSVLSAGEFHTCGVTITQALCWGRNNAGQIGDGSTTDRLSPTAVAGTWSAVTAGGEHTCAVTSAVAPGSVPPLGVGVWCWGRNAQGQLGDGTSTDRLLPVEVSGMGPNLTRVAAGAAHTCALSIAGAPFCWGDNLYGQLGDGTTTDRVAPVPVLGLPPGTPLVAIDADSSHTCGVAVSGAAYCWGANGRGQLGDGTTTDRSAATLVTGGHSFVSIVLGGGHTCATTADGVIFCWGDASRAQLGDPALVPVGFSAAPVRVADPTAP